jgi:predicted nucleic acid-binding protein
VPSLAAHRASQFFQNLVANNGIGIVTPTAYTEFIHVAVKARYRHIYDLMTPVDRGTKYGRPVRNWKDLYKQDETLLQVFLPNLRAIRQGLIANGLLLVAPEELGPVPSGRSHDTELVELVGTYGLDSSDAAILVEARRYGLTDIVTLDVDMQRAQIDFNIYTWI